MKYAGFAARLIETISTAGEIPQCLELQVQVTLVSIGRSHKSGECAKLCARRSACFYNRSGEGVSIGLLT